MMPLRLMRPLQLRSCSLQKTLAGRYSSGAEAEANHGMERGVEGEVNKSMANVRLLLVSLLLLPLHLLPVLLMPLLPTRVLLGSSRSSPEITPNSRAARAAKRTAARDWAPDLVELNRQGGTSTLEVQDAKSNDWRYK